MLTLCMSCTSIREQSISCVMSVVKKNAKAHFKLDMGATGTFGPDKIEALDYYFLSDEVVDLPTARRMVVGVANIIVRSAENDEVFQNEVKNPPFSEKHIYLSIAFPNVRSLAYDEHWIDYVLFSPSTISYYKSNPAFVRYQEVYEETHEEAYRKLAEEQLSSTEMTKE